MFPPHRMLAAVDFSEPSRTALQMAARLAAQCHGELHVVYAEDPLICAAARAVHVRPWDDAREQLAAFTGGAAVASQVVIHPHVIEGHPTDVICTIGRREQADVIVVGTHGASAVDRLVFGTTADAVIHCSELPVLLVPPTWTPPRANVTDLAGSGPIVAGVDFTIGSLEAIAAASTLARLLDTPLQLVHAVPQSIASDSWQGQAVEQLVSRQVDTAHRELDRIVRNVGPGVRVGTKIVHGPVPRALADAVHAAEGHPLLVLGRRRSRCHGDVPGAIAHRVALLTQVPTLMYMAPESGD